MNVSKRPFIASLALASGLALFVAPATAQAIAGGAATRRPTWNSSPKSATCPVDSAPEVLSTRSGCSPAASERASMFMSRSRRHGAA